MSIDVYDFDGTIYNGDSTIDFYFYCLKNQLILCLYIPGIIYGLLLYKLKLIDTKNFKERFFKFLKSVNNLNEKVKQFWIENQTKINSFFTPHKFCYIVTASPEFLIKPLFEYNNNIEVIGTLLNINSVKIEGNNCKGKEKVKRLKEFNKTIEINNFYTDSLDDLPLIEISKKAFIVSNGELTEYKK